ncbi:MAG: DUF488 domain-containing protein [archaeon]|nr:DUF488 domain-containing protein [archaeon]
MVATDSLEVTVKYRDIKQTIKGTPEAVTRAYFDVLGRLIPGFDVASSLTAEPNLVELADKLKNLIRLYKGRVILLRQDLALQDRVLLFLVAKLLGYRINQFDTETANRLEITEAIGKPKAVVNRTIKQLLAKQSIEQISDDSFRIVESKAIQYLTNITSVRKNLSMIRFMNETSENQSSTLAGFRPIFSVGYEGRKLPELVELLRQNAIDILVDVRRDAYSSYDKDFNEKKLSLSLAESHIRYLHMPELGVDYAERQKLKQSHDYEYYFQFYKEYLEKNQELLKLLMDLTYNSTVALLCYERDFGRCHRHVIADKLSKEGIVTVHL